MSKVSLVIDTESKSVILKVDGQQIDGVKNFNLSFWNQYCSKCESYDCECDLPECLAVNFTIEKEDEKKNTEVRINYDLCNRESESSVAQLNDIPGFIGHQMTNDSIQKAVAGLFK